MKPKKFKKRLLLNKRTVANLNARDMNGVYGGGADGDADITPITPLLTIQPDPCYTEYVIECITDPPTMCYTCPMPDGQTCGVEVDPIGDVGVLR